MPSPYRIAAARGQCATLIVLLGVLLAACAAPPARPPAATTAGATETELPDTTTESAAAPATTGHATADTPDSDHDSAADATRTALQSEPPAITHGPMSGEITESTLVLWARGSVTGTLEFAVSEDDDFADIVASAAVDIDAARDFTGEALLDGLEPGTEYAYRATLTAAGQQSDAVEGTTHTAPAAESESALSFVFGACLGGQNYCRNPDPQTGWQMFEMLAEEAPDFFLFMGDTVYVDTPCEGADNLPGAEGPYSDLEGFRTRYRYHLEDPAFANFLAATPIYVTWDDHEVINDFSGPVLQALNPQLFAEGKAAFFEYWPIGSAAATMTGTATMTDTASAANLHLYRKVSYGSHADLFILDTRSYRDPNVNWDPNPNTLEPKSMLGEEQFAWLQESLRESDATWKFIVSSVPLAYPTGFPQPQVDGRDGWANYTERSGYETELMALFFFIEQHALDNVVFLAGDTHWPYALSYDPDRDGSANLYEFGSSPISALPLAPPETPDPTFNPTVLYAEGEFGGDLFNIGHVAVDEAGELTFRVLDRDGDERYTLTLQPE